MNVRFAALALCLGVAFTSQASAFGFGLLGGGCSGCGCAVEPSCCAVEPSCGCDAAPSCCDPCCAPRKCAILDGLKGLFSRNRCCAPACCEPACCVAEPTCCAVEASCCAPEPTCCAAEPTCGCEAPACCDPCCAPRKCAILDGLKNIFKRRSCCAPACCEPACCVAEPTCGCNAAPSCGCGM